MTFCAKKIALFIALASILALSTLFPKTALAGGGMEPIAKKTALGIGDTFAGEELVYDMGFWIFKKIATGKFTISREDKDTFKVVLDASSKARLFRSTRSTFTAYIKESEDKKRFVTMRFEKLSKRKKTIKKIVKKIDHEKGILTITKWKNGKFRSSEEIKIPEGVIYDDPLGAFYNLRYGVYGPMDKGALHLITTFPEKGKEIVITARVASEKALKKGIRRRRNKATVLLKAKLAKELFDSSSGDIDLFFDKNMITIDVVAKDVLLFGDIYAKLKSYTAALSNRKNPTPAASDSDAADTYSEENE